MIPVDLFVGLIAIHIIFFTRVKSSLPVTWSGILSIFFSQTPEIPRVCGGLDDPAPFALDRWTAARCQPARRGREEASQKDILSIRRTSRIGPAERHLLRPEW